MISARAFLVGLLLSAAGCAAPVGTGRFNVPTDAAHICAEQCGQVGMKLSAMAFMAGHVGCVCQPGAGPQASLAAGPAAMATITLLRAQQQQSQPQPK